MKSKRRYRVSINPQRPQELETTEIEESEHFSDFLEEPAVYDGSLPEEGFSILFVDGVRRKECLATIRDEETGYVFEGAFLSLGAGALRVDYGRFNTIGESLVLSKIERLMAFRGFVPSEVWLGFKPLRIEGELNVEVNRYMKEELEARVALLALKEAPATLMVCDGTLSRKLRGTSCLGFIKSIKRLYIDASYIDLLYSLRPGQRSPILKIHYQQRQEDEEKTDKYTWYIKLSQHEGLHGLARVEAFPQKSLDILKKLADLSAGILPLFVGESFQDRRSPQNLLPIGRLEMFLRLHLGDHNIIRREIEKFFHV
ncbi:MAG: DNA double-strand break repair nuclease NurA [Aquificaceae bacterium]|nr:DNA double-strand break repair nuclease NurA [Aquificaceae bacterium]